MPPKLYMKEASPYVRSVLITAAAIGLELEKQNIDLNGDQFSPEYLKLNPQHTVPTLQDGDFVLWDSHAITPYLINKYAKDDSLYPKDLQKQATVNQRLHLNNSYLSPILRKIRRTIFPGQKTVPKENIDEANEVYGLLNTLLEKTRFMAGDQLTIADFHFVAVLSALNIYVPIEETKYPKLTKWYKELTGLPCYQAGVPGLQQYPNVVKTRLGN